MWCCPRIWLRPLVLTCGFTFTALAPLAASEAREAPLDLQAIASNGATLVAVGAGSILKSADSGKTWNSEALETDASLIDVTACPDRSFAALDFRRRLWIGNAEGSGWRSVALPGDLTPMALSCSPAGEYWVVGSYTTVLHSSDRGQSWKQVDFGEDAQLTSIQFLDAQRAFIAGEFGYLLSSTDGGQTWNALPRVPGEFYPFDAWFENTESGWLTGRGGKILRTSDGGRTWRSEINAAGAPMYHFVHAPDGSLFAVGELGLVLRRSGETWQPLSEKTLGGYLRGGWLAVGTPSQAMVIVVVGGSGASTPTAMAVGQAR